MTEELLQDKSNEGILILTLNRPEKRNALSISLLEALHTAITTATQRILILKGNGPSFCAGLDLDEIADPSKKKQATETIAKVFLALQHSPLISIAVIHGPAVAGGAGLLCACDFALASPESHFAFPEVDHGIVPALVSALLVHQLPPKALHELLLLAEKFTAEKALSLGLINQITDDPHQDALTLANKLLAKPEKALQQTKKLLQDLNPITFNRALSYHKE